MTSSGIGPRAAEEYDRVCNNHAFAEMRYGINRTNKNDWKQGNDPSAKKLAALCKMGCDVVYILTGRRANG